MRERWKAAWTRRTDATSGTELSQGLPGNEPTYACASSQLQDVRAAVPGGGVRVTARNSLFLAPLEHELCQGPTWGPHPQCTNRLAALLAFLLPRPQTASSTVAVVLGPSEAHASTFMIAYRAG